MMKNHTGETPFDDDRISEDDLARRGAYDDTCRCPVRVYLFGTCLGCNGTMPARSAA